MTTYHYLLNCVRCYRGYSMFGGIAPKSEQLLALACVVALDGLTLYDYGGVTAFDAAGGCGDGAGDVAGGQEHREPDSQRRQQGQYDLLYILFHCSSF